MSEPARSEELSAAEDDRLLLQLVQEVDDTHGRVVLTRRGRPVAVLVSPEELRSLEETADLAGDPAAQERIARARAAIDAGDVVTGEELRTRFGLPPRDPGPGR